MRKNPYYVCNLLHFRKSSDLKNATGIKSKQNKNNEGKQITFLLILMFCQCPSPRFDPPPAGGFVFVIAVDLLINNFYVLPAIGI